MSIATIDTASNRFTYSNSDNAMAMSANAADKAKVSNLESENEKLQEEVNQLSSENQSLQTRISQFKSAVKVDVSTQAQKSNEVSTETQQYLESNNINMASESANFTKQNVQSQAGSMALAQANTTSSSIQRLSSL